MKPFLILQLRPEREASDDEYAAILAKGGLAASDTHRIEVDRDPLPDALNIHDYGAIIVGGGPGCISDAPDDKSPSEARAEAAIMSLMPQIIAEDHPFLGCCYGMGALGAALGGEVGKQRYAESVGTADCTITPDGADDALLAGLPDHFKAFVGHKEAVQALPPRATHLISAPTCPMQMIRAGRHVYATQFHPEADGDVFAARIRLYKDKGYFDPAQADDLIAACRAVTVDVPKEILKRFVARYG